MIRFEDIKDQTTENYFNGNQFSIDAFKKKYAIFEDETYVQALKRVCDYTASAEETKELQKYWSERWFDEIYNNYWHPAGSIMQGAGVNKYISLMNCTFISLPDDSLEGIIKYNLYRVAKIAAYREGLGVDVSKLRPIGTHVNNSSNNSQGIIHWMKLIDSMGYYVGQSGRIPAMLLSVICSHPDLENFIKVKSDYTKIQNANISVQVLNKFYEAVLEDKNWVMKFELPEIKVGQKIYLNELWDDLRLAEGKDENGNFYISKVERKKEVIKKEKPARELLMLIAENMLKNAEPGIQNIDIAKKYSNSDVVGFPILGTNACMTGNMNLLTDNGYKSFYELSKLDSIPIKNKDGEISNGKVWYVGKKIICKLSYTESDVKYYIKCTPDHVWLTNTNEQIEAEKLHNKRLMPYLESNKKILKDYIALGFIQGNSELEKLYNNEFLDIIINIEDNNDDILEIFPEFRQKYKNGEHKYYCNKYTKLLQTLKFSDKKLSLRTLPETYDRWDKLEKASFLNGLYSVNGYILNNINENIELRSSCLDLINQVKNSLEKDFKIYSNIIKCKEKNENEEYYCLVISAYFSKLKFNNEIGFSLKYKNEKLIKNLIETSPVISVELTNDMEDVYDFNEPLKNWGVVNNFIAHNCSEQYLDNQGNCDLASIFCSKFFDKSSKYDKNKLKEIAISVNRFLDNIITMQLRDKRYATYEQKRSLEHLRRTGAGLTDIVGLLLLNDLEYGSEEGNKLIENFVDDYNYYLYKASINLGKEKGSFKAFDKEKYLKSGFIKQLVKRHPDLEFNFMRNVCVTSIAPTGTLSLMNRNMILSYGIEPAFGIYYWKRTRISGKYEYYFIVPKLVRDIFEERGYKIPINSDTIKDDWEGSKGKKIAKFIEDNKDKVGIKFKSSAEINPINKLELMSKVQKNIDSSISVTYMLSENSKTEDIYNFILDAWKKEIKSIAAFPDKKMYGIISSIPFKELAFKLKEEGIIIHSQNFSEDEAKQLNLSNDSISISSAPERPKILEADIYSITVKDQKFVIVIGLLNNVPYEIFGGHMNGLNFKFTNKKGKIEKIKSGVYKLEIGDDIVVDNFSEQFTPVEQIVFRLVSSNLRYGVSIKFIVEQLSKSTDDITSFTSAITRVLKKYIKDGEKVEGKKCPVCGRTSLLYSEGCISCSCGWSKC